jgi:hypothetical protein
MLYFYYHWILDIFSEIQEKFRYDGGIIPSCNKAITNQHNEAIEAIEAIESMSQGGGLGRGNQPPPNCNPFLIALSLSP